MCVLCVDPKVCFLCVDPSAYFLGVDFVPCFAIARGVLWPEHYRGAGRVLTEC